MSNNNDILKTIRDTIPDLVFYKDKNSVYTGCNPAFEKFAGCSEDELIGKTDAEVFKINAEMAALFIEADRRVLENNKTESIEELITYPDGTTKYVETIKTPLVINGEIIGLLGIARDISTKKEQELVIKEVEERTRIMLDATPLCANFFDTNLNIIDCNTESVKLFGLTDKQEYIRCFPKLSPKLQPCGRSSAEMASEYIEEAFSSGYLKFEWLHQKMDGEPIPSEVTLVRVQRKNEHIVVGYIRDMRAELKARTEAMEAEERNQAMIDSVPVSIALWNDEIDLLSCNKCLMDLYEVDPGTAPKGLVQSLFPEYQADGTPSMEFLQEFVSEAVTNGKAIR